MGGRKGPEQGAHEVAHCRSRASGDRGEGVGITDTGGVRARERPSLSDCPSGGEHGVSAGEEQ